MIQSHRRAALAVTAIAVTAIASLLVSPLVAPRSSSLAAQSPEAIPARYREIARAIIAAAEADSIGAWERIA